MAYASENYNLIAKLRGTDWSERASLILGFFYIMLLVAVIAESMKSIGFSISYKYYLVLMLFLDIIVFFVWFNARFIKTGDSEVISVGFAIRTNEKTKDFYNELKTSFLRQIDDQNLNSVVKLREQPGDTHFTSSIMAEKYIMKKGLRVLIWGDATSLPSKNSGLTAFNIKVSSQHQPMDEANRHDLISTLDKGIKRANWVVSHENALNDLAIVSGNILEISMYSLAVCLISVRKLEDVERGVKILESLLVRLHSKKEDINFPNIQEVEKEIKIILCKQYIALSVYYLLDKKDLNKSFAPINKLLNINPNDYGANIQAARLSWEMGDEKRALSYNSKAAKVKPSDSVYKLNYAFINFYNGKYTKALAQYKHLKEAIRIVNLIDVVEFIMREYDRTSKPALLFASGWISTKYGDHVFGENLLNKFIEISKGHDEFKVLIDEATNLLSKPK